MNSVSGTLQPIHYYRQLHRFNLAAVLQHVKEHLDFPTCPIPFDQLDQFIGAGVTCRFVNKRHRTSFTCLSAHPLPQPTMHVLPIGRPWPAR
ncbi:MAG: hypothetical protein VB142_02540 [Burkholderia sp.]